MSAELDASPAVLILGSPQEVDRYLFSLLRDSSIGPPSLHIVANWIRLLEARGTEFASHAVACHYWLYEYHPAYSHSSVFRVRRSVFA